MSRNQKEITSGTIRFMLLLATAIVLRNGATVGSGWYGWLLLTVPLLLITLIAGRRRSG